MSTNIFNESHHLSLSDTLAGLIEREHKLTPAALARKLGIPTNKITRIVNGDVTDPKASTLIQIASYFDITIQQLLGLEPIVREAQNEQAGAATQTLPIYNLSKPIQITNKWYRWASSENEGGYFVLAIDTDLYEPVFHHNSLLIVNSYIEPEDRSYVVIKQKQDDQHYFIKKYVFEGNNIYLYPINPKMPIEVLDNSLYTTVGVILEVHQKVHTKK